MSVFHYRPPTPSSNSFKTKKKQLSTVYFKPSKQRTNNGSNKIPEYSRTLTHLTHYCQLGLKHSKCGENTDSHNFVYVCGSNTLAATLNPKKPTPLEGCNKCGGRTGNQNKPANACVCNTLTKKKKDSTLETNHSPPQVEDHGNHRR